MMTAHTASAPRELDKSSLRDSRGTGYREFRRGLTPHYHRVWLAIGMAYLVLAGAMTALTLAGSWPVVLQLAAAAAGALVIGYAIAFIGLFIHEAAHYNVAADRDRNDRLANLFIGILMAADVARYRAVHMQHHKLLGTPEDPERSYFSALSLRFVVESLTGIRVLRVLLIHRRQLRATGGGNESRRVLSLTLLTSLALHASIVLGCLLSGFWAAALAWTAGTVVVFPFFASLRQLLEHRSAQADPDTDYSRVPHGPINRLFGDGPLASTLGGAGFNRHLLHHWDPGISCTRLRDVERYLLDTPAAESISERQTTYLQTLRTLYGH